ncbi:MAG: rplW [Rickettsiales bacterium]|jgi:large subunit ribosomal protein L23|nr:rplW [Rickettsiales bacterium]
MSQKKATASMYDVIRRPLITEKSTMGAEQNKLTFEIAPDATKKDVANAVKSIFSVDVTKVNIIRVKGKTKRFRGIKGRRSDVKKAIVTLPQGKTIDIAAGV